MDTRSLLIFVGYSVTPCYDAVGMHTNGMLFYYRPHHSCFKVMILHLSVILSTRMGCVSQHVLGHTPSWADTTPLTRHPQVDTPGQTPSPHRWLLQQTVRILLECILVLNVIIARKRSLEQGNVFYMCLSF